MPCLNSILVMGRARGGGFPALAPGVLERAVGKFDGTRVYRRADHEQPAVGGFELGLLANPRVTREGLVGDVRFAFGHPAAEDVVRGTQGRRIGCSAVIAYLGDKDIVREITSVNRVDICDRPLTLCDFGDLVTLSLGDEEDSDMAQTLFGDPIEPGASGDLPGLLDALAEHGIRLPPDTDDSNFKERLAVALHVVNKGKEQARTLSLVADRKRKARGPVSTGNPTKQEIARRAATVSVGYTGRAAAQLSRDPMFS